MKKNILTLLTVLIIITTSILLFSINKKTEVQVIDAPEMTNYAQFVEQLENDALRELQKLNITQEKLEKGFKKYKKDFENAIQIKEDKSVALPIQELVIEILKEFKLNPNEIKIVSFDHPAPAASCQGAIFINEQRFLRHNPESQRFMIGHEIQHLLSNDSFKDFVINKLIENRDIAEKATILSNYSKIIEQIADNKTALTSPQWAQCYLQFMQESVAQDGNQTKTIHPQHSERLQIAQAIVNQINQQTI